MMRLPILALVLAISLPASMARAQTDALPSLDDMKLQFGTGAVQDNKPQLSPILPAMQGPVSGWDLTQWKQNSPITPQSMSGETASASDPLLGPASYSFAARDGHAHLWIFAHGPGGHPVYELDERGGWVDEGGGSNLFLSANTIQPAPSLAAPVRVTLLAKITRASISYNAPAAKQNGAVQGMAFIGLVVQFPTNGGTSTLFMQMPLASSRGTGGFIIACTAHDGSYAMLSGGALPGQTIPLPFQPDLGPLHPISYDVNAQWRAIAAHPVPCRVPDGPAQSVDFSQINPTSVLVKGIYVGLETQNTDKRAHASDADMPQGGVEVSLQLSNIALLAGK